MDLQKQVSVIVPCYNEEKNINLIYSELKKIFVANNINCYEIIFVNDGSKDNSWQVLNALANQDRNIKCINFSRNFGHQAALTAGYDFASGDAIITMDCDLQDPPNLIIDMLNKWQTGSYIIYARRTNRCDGFLKRITANIYYKFLSAISDVNIPRNVGDFRLIDKKVLETIKKMPERSRYLRGLVAWTGFRHDFVDFARPERIHGVTGYTWRKMFKLAFDGISSFSVFPLNCALLVAFIIFFIFLCFFLYDSFFEITLRFYKYMLYILLFFMGVQCILFWIIGLYMGYTYEQVKGRPLYIIEKTLNI